MSFKETARSQPAVAAALGGYVEKMKLPHALLFSGPAGSGQLEAAAELAQTLFCRQPKEGEPCGACPDCRQVLSGGHADYFVLKPEEGHALKIEPVRELMARAAFKPFQAPAKVLVIDQAHAMNDVAQNAILKTLEEPPAHTYFILISHANEKLLPTIRSRAQTLHFMPRAQEMGVDPEVAAARHELLNYICGEREWKTAETVALEREGVLQVLDLLAADLRHLLLLSADAGHLLGLIEDKPLKERALRRFSEEDILERLETVAEFREKLMSSANLKLALSVLKDELAPQGVR